MQIIIRPPVSQNLVAWRRLVELGRHGNADIVAVPKVGPPWRQKRCDDSISFDIVLTSQVTHFHDRLSSQRFVVSACSYVAGRLCTAEGAWLAGISSFVHCLPWSFNVSSWVWGSLNLKSFDAINKTEVTRSPSRLSWTQTSAVSSLFNVVTFIGC